MKNLILLLSFVLISMSSAMAKSEKVLYANIYADELIKEFDEKLDLGIVDFEIYKEIQGARDYLENSHQFHGQFEKSILEVKNTRLYQEVISDIYENSKRISIVDSRNPLADNSDVIYPSMTRDGNLTGNTYPANVWSLTFDDGPHPSRTNKVVGNLYSRGIEATFFVLTSLAQKRKSVIRNILDAKQELASHSYSHQNLNKLTGKKLIAEITDAKKSLEILSGESIDLFRLPYGSGLRNKEVRKTIANAGMVHVFWNVDTLDWKDKDPQSILKRVKKLMELSPNKSGIILFHDIHNQSVIASEYVMDYLQREGKTICTVGDVVKHLNSKAQSCIR